MTEQEIIQAWKDNGRAFVMMSIELVNWARKADIKNFEILRAADWGKASSFKRHLTYRLRKDYKEEPEVARCEVTGHKSDCLQYCDSNLNPLGSLTTASDHPDFIGFLYDDCEIDDFEVIIPTHVLFRNK